MYFLVFVLAEQQSTAKALQHGNRKITEGLWQLLPDFLSFTKAHPHYPAFVLDASGHRVHYLEERVLLQMICQESGLRLNL